MGNETVILASGLILCFSRVVDDLSEIAVFTAEEAFSLYLEGVETQKIAGNLISRLV